MALSEEDGGTPLCEVPAAFGASDEEGGDAPTTALDRQEKTIKRTAARQRGDIIAALPLGLGRQLQIIIIDETASERLPLERDSGLTNWTVGIANLLSLRTGVGRVRYSLMVRLLLIAKINHPLAKSKVFLAAFLLANVAMTNSAGHGSSRRLELLGEWSARPPRHLLPPREQTRHRENKLSSPNWQPRGHLAR